MLDSSLPCLAFVQYVAQVSRERESKKEDGGKAIKGSMEKVYTQLVSKIKANDVYDGAQVRWFSCWLAVVCRAGVADMLVPSVFCSQIVDLVRRTIQDVTLAVLKESAESS